MAAVLEARLPAGPAPPEPEFWHRPEWWEPVCDWHVLLEREDVPRSVFETLAERRLWRLVAGDRRAPVELLTRAGAEASEPSARVLLAGNPATPEAVLRGLADESRPPGWERLIRGLLWIVNGVLLFVQLPLILGHRLLVLAILGMVRMPAREPNRFRGWRFEPSLGAGARHRAELGRELGARPT